MISPEPIVLHDELLLTQGSSRSIYRHPHQSEWLIKLLRPEYIDRKFGAKAPWYKRLRRLGYFVGFEREFHEQLAVYLHYGAHPSFLYFIVGMQPTDRGLGQIVEIVRGRDGQNAPTLRDLLLQGIYDAQAEQALQRFFDWMFAAPVVISDLTLDNLVYRYDSLVGEHFCIIDGVGDTHLVPLRSNIRWLNLRSKKRWALQLKRQIEKQLKAKS